MTFYSTPGAGHQADVKNFVSSFKESLAGGTTITVPNSGDLINDANGEITAAWSGGTAQTYTSTNTQAYAAGVGLRVVWNTLGIVNGRHVRGSTFMVPITVSGYDTTGGLVPAYKATWEGFVNAFAAAMGTDHIIWSRPVTPEMAEGTDVDPRDGSSHIVMSHTVPSNVTTLRTRRT